MDFFFRISIIFCGYLYPAYMCFSALHSSKPTIEQLRTWCRYWMIMAIFTGVERVADAFISWLPFYSGCKLALIVYLWLPDKKGTNYIYETYVEPFFCKYAESLDQNGVHLRNKLVATSKSLCNKALLAMQLKLTEVIQENVSTFHPVVQSLGSNYISCYAEALAEKVLSHQPTMVIPMGEQLCSPVTPENNIADDGKQDADFETIVSLDSMQPNMQASRFRFRWWRHQHEDQKTNITPRAKRKH